MLIDLQIFDMQKWPFEVLAAELARIVEGEDWISEGAYMTWATPLFQNADIVIWLDTPWRVASFRILSRHVKAELARSNKFPGWRWLYRFWRWSGRYYNDRNLREFNDYGVPNARSVAAEWLEAYRDKLVVCRTKTDIEACPSVLQTVGRFDLRRIE